MRFITRLPRPEELAPLLEQLCDAYRGQLELVGVPRDEADAQIEAFVRKPAMAPPGSDGTMVAALEDTTTGEVIGGFIVSLWRELRLGNGSIMWLKESYRGQASLARKLMRAGEAMLRDGGARRIDIGCVAANERLRRMYERLGYTTIIRTMGRRPALAPLPAAGYDVRPPAEEELADLARTLTEAASRDTIALGRPQAEAEEEADAVIRAWILGSPANPAAVVRVATDRDGGLAGAFAVSVASVMKVAYVVCFWLTPAHRDDAALADLLIRHVEAVVCERGVPRLECPMPLTAASPFEAFERAGYGPVTYVMSKRLDR